MNKINEYKYIFCTFNPINLINNHQFIFSFIFSLFTCKFINRKQYFKRDKCTSLFNHILTTFKSIAKCKKNNYDYIVPVHKVLDFFKIKIFDKLFLKILT